MSQLLAGATAEVSSTDSAIEERPIFAKESAWMVVCLMSDGLACSLCRFVVAALAAMVAIEHSLHCSTRAT